MSVSGWPGVPGAAPTPSVRLWTGSALAVLGLHAGLAAALILRFEWASKSLPPLAAPTVEVVQLPTAPPVPPTFVALGPRRVESRPAQKQPIQRNLPKFEAPPEVKTTAQADVSIRKEEQPEEQQERQSPEVPVTSAPPTVQAKPDKSLEAPIDGAAAQVPTTAEQTWEARILAQLERHKRYPVEAQREHEEDTVYLRFSVDRKGRVLSSQIERSAGHALLDEEVLALIHRASPLPPPPKEVPGDPIELVVPVEFFVKKT